MKRAIDYIASHPVLIILLMLAISLAAWRQLDNLAINISAEELMAERHPAKKFYDHTVELFGSDNVTVVYLQDPDLFDKANLEAVHEAVLRLESLPYVVETQSLFSVQDVKTVEGFISKDPYLTKLPETREEADALIASALRNSFVRNNLLSLDGTGMAISVSVKKDPSDPNFDTRVAEGIEQAITPLKARLTHAFQMGLPYVRGSITKRIEADQRSILPLSLIVLFVTLIITLRRLNGALVPMATGAISILWTLGFMGFLGIPINVLTSLVPVLLIIIGSTEDIHLLTEYYHARATGRSSREAVHYMGNRMGSVITLTFVTSYVGFLSITVNDIKLLFQFGLMASTGLLLNFIVTVFFIPIYLRYFGGKSRDRAQENHTRHGWLARATCHLLSTHKRKIIVLTVVTTLVAGAGAVTLRINNNVMDYFEESSPVKLRLQQLTERLSGIESFSIVLDSRIEGTFLHTRYLQEIREIQDYIKQDGRFDTTISFADYIALLNSALDESVEVYLPETDDVVTELMLFLQHSDVKQYVTEDYATARILVRHHIEDSYEFRKAMKDLRNYLDENTDVGLKVDMTGQSILTNQVVDSMAAGQAKSILLMLIMIFAIVSLLFVNYAAGLVALIPNVVPIIMLFGVMGHLGIPLDTGTAMIAAIAIGIAVDDTMHFMVRYNRELKKTKEHKVAIERTLGAELKPIVATSVSLALGFGVLAWSSFLPVVHFGLLSAMVMLMALYANFFITPIALSTLSLITVWDLLSVKVKRQVMEDCQLFNNLRPWQIKKFILTSEVRHYEKGDYIYRSGDPSIEMYILLDGDVEVSLPDTEGTEAVVERYQSGGLFGEIALLSKMKRLRNAVACEDSDLLVLNWDDIRAIARNHPRMSSKLYLNLSSMMSRRIADQVMSLRDRVREG